MLNVAARKRELQARDEQLGAYNRELQARDEEARRREVQVAEQLTNIRNKSLEEATRSWQTRLEGQKKALSVRAHTVGSRLATTACVFLTMAMAGLLLTLWLTLRGTSALDKILDWLKYLGLISPWPIWKTRPYLQRRCEQGIYRKNIALLNLQETGSAPGVRPEPETATVGER